MTSKTLTWIPQILSRLLSGGRALAESSRSAVGIDQQSTLPRLGVFIDFDNINGAAIPLMFGHLSPRWNCTWRRAYGTGLAKHSTSLHAGGILPIEVVQNTRRKNSADIALVIDVMLAACTNSVEEFCIVSSDGDYTRLALTLREMGKRLVVVGRATTPLSLRSACTEFIDLDELLCAPGRSHIGHHRMATATPAILRPSVLSGTSAERQVSTVLAQNDGRQTSGDVRPVQVDAAELLPLIRELTGDHGTTTLSAIQIRCSRRYADFSPRMCGSAKWRPLLQAMAVFTVEPIRSKGGKIQDYAVAFRPIDIPPEDPSAAQATERSNGSPVDCGHNNCAALLAEEVMRVQYGLA